MKSSAAQTTAPTAEREKAFLETLRHNTQAAHQALEATPYATALMSEAVTRQDYLHYLTMMYGFVKPIEAAAYTASHLLPDVAERTKTHLLEKDMLQLGLSQQAIDHLPQADLSNTYLSDAALWGAMYVMEGSSLGGNVLYKHLHKKLDVDAATDAGYFTAYGAATGSRWKTFLQHFTNNAVTNNTEAAIIDAANQTFQKIRQWFVQYPSIA